MTPGPSLCGDRPERRHPSFRGPPPRLRRLHRIRRILSPSYTLTATAQQPGCCPWRHRRAASSPSAPYCFRTNPRLRAYPSRLWPLFFHASRRAALRTSTSGLTTRDPGWLEAGDEAIRSGPSRQPGYRRRPGGRARATREPSLGPLDEHLRTVGALAETFARGVGLTESLVAALRVAGATHDLGKADPRFQRRLGAPEPAGAASASAADSPAGGRSQAGHGYGFYVVARFGVVDRPP